MVQLCFCIAVIQDCLRIAVTCLLLLCFWLQLPRIVCVLLWPVFYCCVSGCSDPGLFVYCCDLSSTAVFLVAVTQDCLSIAVTCLLLLCFWLQWPRIVCLLLWPVFYYCVSGCSDPGLFVYCCDLSSTTVFLVAVTQDCLSIAVTCLLLLCFWLQWPRIVCLLLWPVFYCCVSGCSDPGLFVYCCDLSSTAVFLVAVAQDCLRIAVTCLLLLCFWLQWPRIVCVLLWPVFYCCVSGCSDPGLFVYCCDLSSTAVFLVAVTQDCLCIAVTCRQLLCFWLQWPRIVCLLLWPVFYCRVSGCSDPGFFVYCCDLSSTAVFLVAVTQDCLCIAVTCRQLPYN